MGDMNGARELLIVFADFAGDLAAERPSSRGGRERFNYPRPTLPAALVQRFVRRVSVAISVGQTLPGDVVHRQAWQQNRRRIDQTSRAVFDGFRQ